jgi:hypothetical protein
MSVCSLAKWPKCSMYAAMQLMNDMLANMHRMHSADVALTYARV